MASRLHLQNYPPVRTRLQQNVPRHTTVAHPLHAAEGSWSPSTRRGYDYLLTSTQVHPSHHNPSAMAQYMPLASLVPSVISSVQTIYKGVHNEHDLSKIRNDFQQQAELIQNGIKQLHPVVKSQLRPIETIERWLHTHLHQLSTAAELFDYKIKDEQFKIASAALELGTIIAISLPTIQNICSVSLGVGLSLYPVANLIPALFTIHGVLHIQKHAAKLRECFQLWRFERSQHQSVQDGLMLQAEETKNLLFAKSLTNQLVYLTAQTIFWLSFTIGVLVISHFLCAEVISLLHATILLFIGTMGTTILQFSVFNQQHAIPSKIETISSKIAANNQYRSDMLQHLLNIESHTQHLEDDLSQNWSYLSQKMLRLYTQHLIHLPHVARIFSKIFSYFKPNLATMHEMQIYQTLQACIQERQQFMQQQLKYLAQKEQKHASIVEKMRQYLPESPLLLQAELTYENEKQEQNLLSTLLTRYNQIQALLENPVQSTVTRAEIIQSWRNLNDPFWGTNEPFFANFGDLLAFNHVKASNDRYTLLWLEQFVRSRNLKAQCDRLNTMAAPQPQFQN